MHSDLVRAAGFEFELHEGVAARVRARGCTNGRLADHRSGSIPASHWRGRCGGDIAPQVIPLAHAADRHRVSAELIVPHDLLLAESLVARWVRPDRHLDHLHVGLDPAFDEGEIAFVHAPMLELVAELPVGFVLLCEDDDARRVTVQPMYHAGACELLADLGEIAPEARAIREVEGEGREHRALQVAAGRVDDDVGLLVDHDDVLIFKQHVEGDVLGLDVARRRRGHDDLDDIATAQIGGGLRRACVDHNTALVDELLELVAAHEADAIDEVLIEALIEVTSQHEPHGAQFGIILDAGLERFIECALHRFSRDPAAGQDKAAGGRVIMALSIRTGRRHHLVPRITRIIRLLAIRLVVSQAEPQVKHAAGGTGLPAGVCLLLPSPAFRVPCLTLSLTDPGEELEQEQGAWQGL